MLFPASKLGDTIIGVDLHDVLGMTPAVPAPIPTPVPKFPHPFVGSTQLWHSPAWPMANVFVNGVPAAAVGCKGYSVHMPPILPPPVVFSGWVPPPQISMKWYLTNLLTVGVSTAFSIAINVVKGIVDPMVTGRGDVPSVWDSVKASFSSLSWLQLFQSLLPPAVLPVAEGNHAIGSPTVTVNGAPFALVGPMFASSCTTIPATLAPNASVVGFSNVMVGLSLMDFLLQVFWNGVSAASSYAAGKIVDKYKCKLGLEPIDIVSGANFEDRTDFELPGIVPLKWSRSYRSLRTFDGPLGFSWAHEFGQHLEAAEEGFDYVTNEGMRYRIPVLWKDGDSIEHPMNHFVVTRVSESVYTIRLKDNRVLTFEWANLSSRAYLTSISDLNGNAIKLSYDKYRRLSTINDTHRRGLVLDYNEQNRIIAVRMASDGDREVKLTLVSYSYSQNGDLVTMTDAVGRVTRYEYDNNHWMTKKTDRRGYSFHYEYNSIGQCVKSWGDDGLYSGELEYYPLARTTIFTIPNGAKRVYKHNDINLVTNIIDPYGAVQTYQYDDNGHLDSEIDPNNNVRRLKYDKRGNVVEEEDFDGRKTKRLFDDLNLKTEEMTPSGAKKQWKYDERGNLLEEVDEFGGKTAHEYDNRGWRIKTTEPDGTVKVFRYDNQGRLSSIRSEAGVVKESFVYDSLGNILVHNVAGRDTRFRYDEKCRLLETTLSNGTRVRRNYDEEGNLTAHEDEHGRVWHYKYTSWNKLTEMTDPAGRVTRYEYNNADELVKVADPGGTMTVYEYDLNDRIARIHRDGALRETYRRDAAGNIVEKADSSGNVLTKFEVGKGNHNSARESSGTEARFEWDDAGRLKFSERGGFAITTKYDELDRVTEQSWNGDSVKYEFDKLGRLAKTQWSEGVQHEFTYSETGGSLKIKDSTGVEQSWLGIGSQMQARVLPNGLVETRLSDSSGRLLKLEIRSREGGDGRVMYGLHQKYDKAGNLVARRYTHTGNQSSFGYDSLGRIMSVSVEEGRVRKVAYDAGGNALADERCEVSSGNRLAKLGDLRYEYDARGNVTGRTVGTRTTRLRYDDLDNVIESADVTGAKTRYLYDGQDKLCRKETSQGNVEFHWSGHRIYREVFGANHRRLYVYYSHDAHCPAAFIELTRDSAESEWTSKSFQIHSDGNDTPVAISDESGTVVWTMEPRPFGEFKITDESSLDFDLRYPGQIYDSSTGLCWNGYRTYDPLSNRFLQSDPLGLKGGLNLYAYPANPLQQVDLYGLSGGGGHTGEGHATPKEDDEAAKKEAAKKAATSKPTGEDSPDNEAHSAAEHEKYKEQLRKEMGKPACDSPEMQKIADKMYRDDAKIGSGSTADAVREERATGQPTIGGDGKEYWHEQKAQNTAKELDTILSNDNRARNGEPGMEGHQLSNKDRAAAENMQKDLQNALETPTNPSSPKSGT